MRSIGLVPATVVALTLAWPAQAASEIQDVLERDDAEAAVPPVLGADAGAPPPEADAEDDVPPTRVTVTAASWGGGYGESQELGLFAPFREDGTHELKAVTHDGDAQSIERALSADPAPWDAVELSAQDLADACRADLLARIDPARLAAARDGGSAKEDYLPGGLHDCGAGSVAWSAVLVHDRRGFDEAPRAIADLLDLERFPGNRALPRQPRYTLEVALLADGVDPDDVYATLATPAGIERALGALDRIADHIVWWDSPRRPLELLASGEAALALAFNGRVFASMMGEGQPLAILWDGQIYHVNMWAIPRNAQHTEAALDFIAFATRPERLAAQTRWFPYGPMRASALELVGKHAEVDVDMTPFLPTAPDNFANALRFDGAWWAEHEYTLHLAFESWLAVRAAQAAAAATEEDEDNDAEADDG